MMILKIAHSYIHELSDHRTDWLTPFWLEDSTIGAYGFYEIDSPMDIPWLFHAESGIQVIDQLQMETVT
jgi:hypothetical protein